MKKALIIEDNSEVSYTLRRILESYKYEVDNAENGKSGRDMANSAYEGGAGYHLIFCDIILPEQDGITTIRQIKDSGHKAKIIAISGGGKINKQDYLKAAKAAGADIVLHKPFDSDDIQAIC